ncbi:FkbM family methyltransferase [Salinactinospora qingdaonensis]|uniref:Methyltransferase FkbM domain-containing protein n=1 Tax=Salinactinospora qingdaonensis TaxID=702744 RepID=A0ABP7GAW8_9ACTN
MGQGATRPGTNPSGEVRAPRPGTAVGATSPVDYRSTAKGRRQSWYGAKKHVKRFLGWRLPNLAMRGAVHVAAPELLGTGRLPAPAAVREVTGHVAGTTFVMLDPARCIIAKELYWGNGHRPGPADDFAVRLFAAAARRADTVLDIGAYTGLFTLVATSVNPELRAHSFEIVPEVYHALFDNCVRNRVVHRTTLHHTGVGDPEQAITMPVRSGDSALPCYYSGDMAFTGGVPISVLALDSFTDQIPANSPVVMKIDVEGTEATVLEHGQRFIARHRPDILCEVLPGADGARLARLLQPYGYQFHVVGDGALAASGTIIGQHRFRDWFFTVRSPEEVQEMGISVIETAH